MQSTDIVSACDLIQFKREREKERERDEHFHLEKTKKPGTNKKASLVMTLGAKPRN
jgi:hypothetical protein